MTHIYNSFTFGVSLNQDGRLSQLTSDNTIMIMLQSMLQMVAAGNVPITKPKYNTARHLWPQPLE